MSQRTSTIHFKFEIADVLIEYGFLDKKLCFDRYGPVQTEWEFSKSVIYGIRKHGQKFCYPLCYCLYLAYILWILLVSLSFDMYSSLPNGWPPNPCLINATAL